MPLYNLTTDLSIAGQSTGDLLYFDGSHWIRLASGTSGKYLQTKGSATPVWISSIKQSAVGTTSAPTTTSASYVVIPQMTVTITTSGGNVLILFNGAFNVQSNDDFTIGIHEDSVLVAGTEQRSAFFGGSLLGLTPAAITSGNVSAIGMVIAPSAGSHTYDVRWKVAAGTARAITTQRQIIVTELL